MNKQYKKLVVFDFDGASNDSYQPIKATFESFNFPFLSRSKFRSHGKYGKFLRHGFWKDLRLCFHVLTSEFAQSLITHYQLFACGKRSSFYPQIRELILELQKDDDVAILFLSRNFLSNVAFQVLMQQILRLYLIPLHSLCLFGFTSLKNLTQQRELKAFFLAILF